MAPVDCLTAERQESQDVTSPSLLFREVPGPRDAGERDEDRSFERDLNLDQVVAAIAADREERDLVTETLFGHLRDADAVRYRQEVFRDLDDPDLLGEIRRFADLMAEVRRHLNQLAAMHYRYQREGWLLDAAAIYCEAVRSLAAHLASARLSSRALLAFRDYLARYVAVTAFTALEGETKDRKDALGRIRYGTRIKGDRVEVTRYAGEADYSAAVLETFERFKQGPQRRDLLTILVCSQHRELIQGSRQGSVSVRHRGWPPTRVPRLVGTAGGRRRIHASPARTGRAAHGEPLRRADSRIAAVRRAQLK
jgi:hypothetical protein